jgi:predicted double-glycine peptidase
MHVLIGFLIIVGLLGGFFPIHEPPPEALNVSLQGAAQTARSRPLVKPLSEIQDSHLIKQMYDYSCGSAALATILNFQLGEKLSEKQVIQGLLQYGDRVKIAQRRAFSLLDMKRFVSVLGYQAAGYKASIEDLRTLGHPCIVPVKIFDYRHFAVFRGIYHDHVFLADPWRGNSSFTLTEFEKMWYENVIFMINAKDHKEIHALQLSEEDLRFIDEDAAHHILVHPQLDTTLDVERYIDDQPGQRQIYNPR